MGSSERSIGPAGIFLFRKEQLASDDILLMETAARVVIDGARGPLSSQLDRIEWARSQPEPLMPSRPPGRYTDDRLVCRKTFSTPMA